jgi:WD40 repeat protein
MADVDNVKPGRDAEEFFIAGGTLRPTVPSYIERGCDRELFEALSRSEFCYVLDTRQMGKSSLMARVASRLRRELGFEVVILDLTSIGQNVTFDQWYDAQLGYIGRQLNLEDEIEDFSDAHPGLGAVDSLVRVLREVVLPRKTSPVVIFVDEIDYVRSLPFSTDEFFAAVRQFYNLRPTDPNLSRLSFCLLGVSTPNELIRSEEITPFNLGRRIDIKDFTLREAEALITGFRTDEATAKKVLERVLHWTDGHPYLTQRLCSEVARADGPLEPSLVDSVCQQLFLAPGGKEQNDNLRFVARRLLAPGVDPAAILDLYGKVRRGDTVLDDGRHPLAEVLRLSGLVKSVGGKFRVRNEIYKSVFNKTWISENLPGQELRRLRRARIGASLRTAAGLALVGALILAFFVWRALNQQRQANTQLEKLNTEQQELLGRVQKSEKEAVDARQLAEQASAKLQVALNDTSAAHKEALRQGAAAEAAKRLAEDNRRLAETAREDALQEAARTQRQSTSRRLALLAMSNLENELDLALLLSAESVKMEDNVDSQNALDRALEKAGPLRAILHSESRDGGFRAGFSPDGRTYATASINGFDLWDLQSFRMIRSVRLDEEAFSVVYSPNGAFVAAAGSSGLRVWNADRLRQGDDSAILSSDINGFSAAFSPDSRFLAVVMDPDDGVRPVEIWDISQRRLIAGLAFPETTAPEVRKIPLNATFSPNGKWLAIVGGASFELGGAVVGLWDVSTWDRKLPLLEIPEISFSLGLVFSPDSKLLAVGGVGGLSPRAGQTRRSPEEGTGSAVLLGVSDSGLRELDTLSVSEQSIVVGMAFRDSTTFLTATLKDDEDENGQIIPWDIRGIEQGDSPARDEALNVVGGGVTHLTFSPDGKVLAVNTTSGKNLLLEMDRPNRDPGESDIQRACRIANRALTEEEWNEAFGRVPYAPVCRPSTPVNPSAARP